MKISVVINNYNNQEFLTECLDSVLAQSRLADEIVIVDDGSTDDSMVILREYAEKNKTIRLITQSNSGQLAAVNTGIHHATGDLLFFLDGDDLYERDHLQQMESKWGMYPDTGLMYCRYNTFGDQELIDKLNREYGSKNHYIGHIDPEKCYDWGYSLALAYYLPEYFIGNVTSTISIKKSLASNLKIQEFINEHLFFKTGNADLYILLATSLFAGRKVYVPERTVRYRIHRNGATNDRKKSTKYAWDLSHHLIKSYLLSSHYLNEDIFDLLEIESLSSERETEAHTKLYQIARNRAHAIKAADKSMSLRGQLAKAEDRLNDIKRSKSWKITAPLRWMENKLRMHN